MSITGENMFPTEVKVFNLDDFSKGGSLLTSDNPTI
jgi:hypothetical protein